MSIVNNILNDEYGLVYDNTTGRIYQKEVTWECDNQNANSDVMPDWFKKWTQTQQINQSNMSNVPRWFLDWLNKANISLPQVPSIPISSTFTTSSPMDIPPWFKEWLNTQYRPQLPQPYHPYTYPTPPSQTQSSNTPIPQTISYQTYPPQPYYPYPYQTPPQTYTYPPQTYTYPTPSPQPYTYPPQTTAPSSTYSTPIVLPPTTIPNTPTKPLIT